MIISRKENRPESFANSAGEILQEILGQTTGGVESHSLALVRIPQGKSSIPHYHKKSEETYYILSGKGHISINDQTFQLHPGDACYIESEETHKIWNEDGQELVFLAICLPAWQPDDSFDSGGIK